MSEKVKCYVVIFTSKTMNEVGYVYLDEDNARISCDRINKELSGSSSVKAYYLTTELYGAER